MTSWERMWSNGLKPGQAFDAGRSSPAFLEVLRSFSSLPAPKCALVPGCGRGYDVIEFAKHGFDAVGVDISPTAIQSAVEYGNTTPKSEMKGSIRFLSEDILSKSLGNDSEAAGMKYDVVYDYTFLCALDPSLRQTWASTLKRLLKPTGELITLIFPLGNYEGGPPFAMSVELVRNLLEREGFEPTYLQPVPPEMSHPGRGGKEALGRWRLKG